MACMALMGAEGHVGAVEITDGVGFQWKRFLRNQRCGRDIIGPGVLKVFAARFTNDSLPSIVVCRVNESYCTITPGSMPRQLPYAVHHNWRPQELLATAAMATTPWMQVQIAT